MTRVFEPHWVEELHKRYGPRPKFQQPAIYRVATQSEWAKQRELIEERTSLLTLEKQEGVISRLRHAGHFFAAYNELAVGDVLRHRGHIIEYERLLGTRTPDWYVSPSVDLSGFFVEVATVLPSKDKQKEARAWGELSFSIGHIEHYFDLEMGTHRTSSLIGKDIKSIGRFVNRWLNSFDPDVTVEGHETTYKDGDLKITFELLPRKTTGKKAVSTYGPVFTGWADIELLRDTIRKKLNKYREAKDFGIPLVVAVVPAFESGLSIDSLLDVLFGREQVSVLTSEASRDRTGMVLPRTKQGQRVTLNTRLSAVVLLEQANNGAEAIIAHNPFAQTPVSPLAFSGLRNVVVKSKHGTDFEMEWAVPQ